MTATGLDSFYLKRSNESMSETLISEPSLFPNTQTTPGPIEETPNSNSAYVYSKKLSSLETQFAALKLFITAELFDVKSQIELSTRTESIHMNTHCRIKYFI